jgi:membrane protein DedA with SNARE-associated domain
MLQKNFLRYFLIGGMIATLVLILLLFLPNSIYKSWEDYTTLILSLVFGCVVFLLVSFVWLIYIGFRKNSEK